MRSLHRFAATFVAILLILTSLPFQSNAVVSFVDVPEDSWFSASVEWAVANKLTTGTSETEFSPDDTCTRGQIVTFLWRQAGSPCSNLLNSPFVDVTSDAYYYQAVLWAVSKNITNGTSDTTFGPDEPCTRAHIVTFLWRAAGKTQLDVVKSSLTDVITGEFYTMPVFWAIRNGITAGTTTTTFSPNDPCTRAQAVTFIYRCFSGVECKTDPQIHLYQLTQTIEANCTAPLTRAYHCVICNQDIKETEGDVVHKFFVIGDYCATCTKPAMKEYGCTRCGIRKTESSGKPLGHLFWVEKMCATHYPTPSNPHYVGVRTCAYTRCGLTEEFDEIVEPHNSSTKEELEIVSRINQERAAVGRSALRVDTKYYDCSKWRAYETLEYLDSQHTRPSGKTFDTILDDLKLPRKTIGENLFKTSENVTAKDIHESFMNSPGHKKNILDPEWHSCSVYILKFYDVTICLENFYA